MATEKHPKPMGRPRIYQEPRQRLTLEMPADLVRHIDEQARSTGMTRTAWIEAATRAYHSLDILNTITGRLADLASRGSMSPVDYAQAKDAAQAAYLAQDEDVLMRLLRQYVPSDPRNE